MTRKLMSCGHFYDSEEGCPHCRNPTDRNPSPNQWNQLACLSVLPEDWNEVGCLFPEDNLDFSPVVGWLVCIKGPSRGKDYRLQGGRNTVGREMSNHVSILGDNTITRGEQCIITYDAGNREYFITEGTDATNPTRLNGRALRQSADLAAHAQIELGETTLIFVPLCDERFTWIN